MVDKSLAWWEPLSKNCKVYVTKEHGFNTDTILLANFAAPKKTDICADFGTGCGTIPLIWAARYNPKQIFAIELQEQAFLQAETSVKENEFINIGLIHGDINDYKSNFDHQSLSLISCNPPYKAMGAGIKNVNDKKRIARHEEELTLDELAKAAVYSLKFGGRICICQRPERLTDAMDIFRANKLEPKILRLVQQRENKAPSLFLLECRRGSKSGLNIMPTLIIESENGFSKEMSEIYGEYRNEAEE